MVIARKMAYNVLFNAGAKILSTALALVGIGFITRYLGQEGFGNYATVLAFFAFFAAIGDLGIYSIATREISREGADESAIIGKIFTLRLSISILIALASPVIFFLPYPLELKIGIIISALSFIFSSSYGVLNGIFQKNLAMDKVSLVELSGKIIQVGLIALVVKKDWGFGAINLALLAYMIFNFVMVFYLSHKYIPFKLQIDLPYWKKFVGQSWPMGISVLVTFLYFKLDTILLSLMKSGSDVGIYSAAYKIIENLTFFPAMVVGLTFPLTSKYIFTDRKEFDSLSDKTFKFFSVVILPLAIGAFFLAPEIIRAIGGAGFDPSINVLRILIFALIFIFFSNFFNNILLAGNKQKTMMKISIFCAIANISMNLVLIPAFSYIGAAITSAITELIVVGATIFLTHKHLKYRPHFSFWPELAVSGLAMATFMFLMRDVFSQNFIYRLIFLGLGGVLSYLFSLWATKAVKYQELSSIFVKTK